MRRLRNALVLLCTVVLYAGSANAVLIDVLGPDGASVQPSEVVSMDVLLDTEGWEIIGYQFHVGYDPAVLSHVGFEIQTPPGFCSYGVRSSCPWTNIGCAKATGVRLVSAAVA